MKKLKFVLVPIFILIVLLVYPASSFAVTSVTQAMITHAVKNNKDIANAVIIQNTKTNEYYAVGVYGSCDTNTVKNGNWVYRTYKNVQGLTSPGWYILSIQLSPAATGVSYKTVNGIDSNSFVQLSGDFSHLKVVYSHKDILKEDGSVYYPAGFSSVTGGDSGNTGDNTGNTGDNTDDNKSFWDKLISILQGFFGGVNNSLDPKSDKFILKEVEGFLSGFATSLDPSKPNFILKTVENSLSGFASSFNPNSDKFILKMFDPNSNNFVFKVLIGMFSDLFNSLFVPSEESFENLGNVVMQKFAFVEEIKNTVNKLNDIFNKDIHLPVLKINLNSKYYSGEVTVLDLGFFKEYKTYTDLVITAFFYIAFAWRIFKNLPNIISGVSSIAGGLDV